MRRISSEKPFQTGPLYWVRFGSAIVVGLVCGALGLGVIGMAAGLAGYLVTLLVPSLVYGLPLRGQGQPREYYTVGLGPYLAVWMTIWILVNTVRNYW